MKKLILSAFAIWGFSSGAYAYDIETTWTSPSVTVDGFTITHNHNGTQLDDVTVAADVRAYTYPSVATGVHMFTLKGFVGELNGPVLSAGALVTDEITFTIEVK